MIRLVTNQYDFDMRERCKLPYNQDMEDEFWRLYNDGIDCYLIDPSADLEIEEYNFYPNLGVYL